MEDWLADTLNSPTASGLGVIVGVDSVRSRLIELAHACRSSLWAFQPDGPQKAETLAAARPLDEETLARGVSMRTIFLDSVRNDEATLDHADWLTARGAELRTVPNLPMRLLVVDKRVAVVPIQPEDSSHGALIVTTPSLVNGLAALFHSTWRGATPFARVRPRRRGLFNAQELQALELWAQGYTDDAVARRLGVSNRTVRRVSESVAAALGANSRFQAGLRAAELGLISSSELP